MRSSKSKLCGTFTVFSTEEPTTKMAQKKIAPKKMAQKKAPKRLEPMENLEVVEGE